MLMILKERRTVNIETVAQWLSSNKMDFGSRIQILVKAYGVLFRSYALAINMLLSNTHFTLQI